MKSIKGAGTETDALAVASKYFAGRSAVNIVDAVRSGKFNIDEMTKAMDNNRNGIQATADRTLTLSGAWGKFKQRRRGRPGSAGGRRVPRHHHRADRHAQGPDPCGHLAGHESARCHLPFDRGVQGLLLVHQPVDPPDLRGHHAAAADGGSRVHHLRPRGHRRLPRHPPGHARPRRRVQGRRRPADGQLGRRSPSAGIVRAQHLSSTGQHPEVPVRSGDRTVRLARAVGGERAPRLLDRGQHHRRQGGHVPRPICPPPSGTR